MANSMVHWDGHHCAACDTETSGLNSKYHEILSFACIAVDSNFKMRTDVMPFEIKLKPEYPERADPTAMRINKLNMDKLMSTGINRIDAIDMFEAWWGSLDIPFNSSGYNQCKIMPLGQNFGFDRDFIQAWMGNEAYNHFFHYHYFDSMISAQFINNCHAMKGEEIPFPHVSLTRLCKKLGISHEGAHDALQDCHMTIQVYHQLVTKYRILG